MPKHKSAKHKDLICIPREVLINAKSLDDVDDWVEAHNPAFIKEMLRIHREAVHEKGKSLAELRKEWKIKD